MTKVKNKRENHDTKRVRYYAERGREYSKTTPKSGGVAENKRSHGDKDRDKAKDINRDRDRDRYSDRDRYREGQAADNVIIGRNPVMEALKSGREVDKLMVSGREGSMIKILAIAKEKSVPVIMVEKAALDRIAGGRPHQGVIAYVSPYDYSEMENIFALAQ